LNEEERAQLRKEEKDAASFKKNGMKKQEPFLPTLKTRGTLQVEYVTSIDSQTPYITGREKEKND
jgi:hypothetical protein